MTATSALFNDQESAVASIRANQLVMAASNSLPDIELGDDFIFSKLLAAESEAVRILGCFLRPTEIFNQRPSQAEIDALNGAPYFVEAGYDMAPDFFTYGHWGAMRLRQRPVIAVDSVSLVHPSMPTTKLMTVPPEWILLDPHSGDINVVPTTGNVTMQIPSIYLGAMAQGATLPQMIRVRYRAGLTPDHHAYEDVRDAVLRLSMVRLLRDAFLPQSGSISADGLSQSFSADVSRFESGVRDELTGIREHLVGVIFGVC